MFVEHKQLKSLQMPASRIAHLHAASGQVQLAFTVHPPQLCQAYLLKIKADTKVLVMVAFYLLDSRCPIFFLPKTGEVLDGPEAEAMYDEGYGFIESMGFILTETDYHLLSAQKKQRYWANLPICRAASETSDSPDQPDPPTEVEQEGLKALRARTLQSLGRFLASF